MVVSLFLFLLAGKLIQYQMVNYFVAVSGKLIHNHVVKKFIDIYTSITILFFSLVNQLLTLFF